MAAFGTTYAPTGYGYVSNRTDCGPASRIAIPSAHDPETTYGPVSCAPILCSFFRSLNGHRINAHNIRDQFPFRVVSDKNNHAAKTG